MLAIISTHPIQYHAPVYRFLQQQLRIPLTVIYGSDFSVAGYKDQEFGAFFSWNKNLLEGYDFFFLSRVFEGGASSSVKVSSKGLRDVLRRINPKAVLILGYSPSYNRAAFFEARRLKCPILFRSETTDHARKRGWFKKYLRDRFLAWFYQRCTKLLYIGQHSRHHFERLKCSADKLIFSPYCVDTSPFRMDETARSTMRENFRKKFNFLESHRVLLFSGKLSYRKGPDLLIEAIKKLPQEVRERVRIVFLGDGALRKELEKQAGKSPEIPVVFIGFKNQNEISPYFHGADLLVLPSRSQETWGLVVNEALHHGVPCVVSSAVGSAPDLIVPGVTGEVFETSSLPSFIEALLRAIRLIGDPKVREACRDQVSSYNIEHAAEGIAQAYESVVRTKDSVERGK